MKFLSVLVVIFFINGYHCEGNTKFRVEFGDEPETNGNVVCGGGGNDKFCEDISAYMPKKYSAYARTRSGSATTTHSCDTIRGVPSHLTFITRYNFYRKYTEAYGIPVISSAAVSDRALKRACYILRFLFADRRDTRGKMYEHFGRFAVIGIREGTTTIPEHSHLPAWWNTRARGLGAMVGIPVSTGGEENLLCLSNDRYRGDDIYFHEASHAVAELAIRSGAIPGFYPRLERQYRYALSIGKWARTYSADTVREYFAEGVQSFFNCHTESIPGNGIHGAINTRHELKAYDPGLYNLLREVFPCMNSYQMCPTGRPTDPRMNCDGSGPVTNPPVTGGPPNPNTDAPSGCTDKSQHCKSWAGSGYCTNSKHKDYMKENCCKSCGSSCQDNNSRCAEWAGKGECDRNPGYMHVNCMKSCRKC